MKKRLVSGLLVVAMLLSQCSIGGESKAMAADADMVSIVINGESVEKAADNVNGLTYKGFGVLSANSTSNLLMDYKYEAPAVYEQMLEVLFGGEHPLMNHVKIEMGNDGNNSTGADSCTMRFEDEEADASRSPGFILAADAKKVNPSVKVSVLRWEMPGWVQEYWDSDRENAGYEAMYKWYSNTIFDAYHKYGYILDYVNPDKNETGNPDEDFIKWFKDRISNEDDFPDYMDEKAREAYHNMKIIASDENVSLNIVPSMRKDSELYEAVDAIGFHYSTGTKESTADYVRMADEDDKEVWYSEGCGSFSYSEYQENKNTAYGGGTLGGYQSPIAMCDCMVKSAVYSRKSHYIFQPAIGSFYEGSQYDHKELLSAREPWSGHIHYDEAIYCLSHFTKFAKTGWENADNTAGIWRIIADASGNNSKGTEHLTNEEGQPSYLTLASPDKKDFSTVIVNNSEKELTYSIETTDMDIKTGAVLEKWVTMTDSYMQYQGEIAASDNKYIVKAEPFSVVTVTTLDCDSKEEYKKRLPEEGRNPVLDTDSTGSRQDISSSVLYADDFEYGSYDKDYLKSRGNEPRYMVDYSGAFAVEDGKLVQVLDKKISQWQNNTPSTVLGDHRWMNYRAQADITLPEGGFAGIVIREQTGLAYNQSGYSLKISDEGSWELHRDYTYLASGKIDGHRAGSKHTVSLEGNDNVIIALIDGKEVARIEDKDARYFGRVRLFSGWNKAYYDNLLVEKSENAIPYGETLIDNASDKVSYEGNWTIASNGSSNDWYRSTSKSSEEGASFTFDIESDGFALIGKNDMTACVDIFVDNEIFESDVTTNKSANHYSSHMTNGLGQGKHKVKVVLKSGSFVLDAIMPIGNIPVNVKTISLNDNLTIKPGEKYALKTSVEPAEATYKELIFSSSDKSVATVDSVSGLVTAVKEGIAVITAYTRDGSKVKKECVVTVKNAVINTINNISSDTKLNTPVKTQEVTVKKETAPKAPKLISVKLKGKKCTVKWSKVSKASGYIVMRSSKKNKGFKKIANIKGAKKVSYIDKKAGKKYYYKVCAYVKSGSKTVKGKYSAVKKAK